MLRVFIPGARRECQRINYTRRRTGNRLLDTGSTPVYSIEKVPFLRHFFFHVASTKLSISGIISKEFYKGVIDKL